MSMVVIVWMLMLSRHCSAMRVASPLPSREMVSRKEDFTKTLINRDNGVIITIGNENQNELMQDCSLITATYHVDGKMVGKIGVVGPTRMRYGEVTSVVEYLTDNISKAFMITEGDKDD